MINLTADWQDSFTEIECYQDDDVNGVLSRLLSDEQFKRTIGQLFSDSNNTIVKQLSKLENIHTIEHVQLWVEETMFPLIAQSYSELTFSGLSELTPSKSYIFISNHRDIVMDPLLINQALRANRFSTAHCAIGDNLLVNQSANDLALLNRCFKVFRSLKSPKSILKAMKTQSAYIQYLHFNKNENVWIAQKEGRAKDNIDKTNPALIKMLSLAKPKEIVLSDYLSNLNIVPVSLSYEWDPCDIDKALELEAQETNINHMKSELDDFIATKKGMEGDKGKIHLHFGKAIQAQSTAPLASKQVAELIDQEIKKNYQRHPVNFAAYKKIIGFYPEQSNFTKQQINAAGKQLELRLKNQRPEIAKRVYQAYAQILS